MNTHFLITLWYCYGFLTKRERGGGERPQDDCADDLDQVMFKTPVYARTQKLSNEKLADELDG